MVSNLGLSTRLLLCVVGCSVTFLRLLKHSVLQNTPPPLPKNKTRFPQGVVWVGSGKGGNASPQVNVHRSVSIVGKDSKRQEADDIV
jgi:hypothetical protein